MPSRSARDRLTEVPPADRERRSRCLSVELVRTGGARDANSAPIEPDTWARGRIANLSKASTQSGLPWVEFVLEGSAGSLQCARFPRSYALIAEMLEPDQDLEVHGKALKAGGATLPGDSVSSPICSLAPPAVL